MAWRRIEDVPAYDDLIELVDSDTRGAPRWAEVEDAVGSPAQGLKVGGWPSVIQSALEWPDASGDEAAFCVQIDSDADGRGLNLWDGGTLYLGRRTGSDPWDPEGWVATSQSL